MNPLHHRASPWTRVAAAAAGFTLIEVMITVAIVAILATVAYPAYLEQVAKGRRADAQAVLLAAQQWMERFYSENYSYAETSAGVAVTASNQFPARFSTVPTSGGAYYTIELTGPDGEGDPTANAYRITATRTGSMSSDACGDFTLNHLGAKGLENASRNLTDCWK